MAIDVTPGGENADSYCTVEHGDAYHATHLYASVWTGSTTARKESALKWATRLLDEQVEWNGEAATLVQSLRWPRVAALDREGSTYLDSASIPTFLKNATAELARHLLAGDRTQERSIGLQSVTADTVEVVFDKHDLKPFLPPSVRSIVQPFGLVKGAGGGTAKLVRA